MSEHDQILQNALEENARLRSEREESVREVASTEYSGRLRSAERIYWLYALPCVTMGVSAIRSSDRSAIAFSTSPFVGEVNSFTCL